MSISDRTFSATRQAAFSRTGGRDPNGPLPVTQLPDKSRAGPGATGFAEIADHIEALREHGAQLAGAASRAGLDARPTRRYPPGRRRLSEEEGRIHAHQRTGEPAGPSDCVVSGPVGPGTYCANVAILCSRRAITPGRLPRVRVEDTGNPRHRLMVTRPACLVIPRSRAVRKAKG